MCHARTSGDRPMQVWTQIGFSRIFLASFLLCILTTPLRAQSLQTSVSGMVLSKTGTRVANPRVSFKNAASGETQTVVGKDDGSFTAGNFSPGTYEIIVSAPGFADWKLTVVLHRGANHLANVVLDTELVSTGTGTTATGAGETPGIRDVVTGKTVADLPLNGRSASDLATLEPGVASARTQTTGQAQRGFGNQMTISGGRPRQNDSRLDGVSVNDYSNGPPASALGVSLGSDAVEQFTVLTSNYPAQFGRSSGGIIGASTRSGTKAFHGSVFEYLRNSAFDARNFFDTVKPAFHRNQFGASAGGPISKERTFIFGDYEGLRQSQGITQVATVPSAAARAGNLSTGKVMPSPAMQAFIDAFYPLPNGPLLGAGDTGIYTFAGQTVTPENYFTVKLDHKFSDQDSLSGTYMFDKGDVRQPDELNDKRTGYDSERRFGTVHEVHTFSPTLVNSARFGVNRVVALTGLNFASGNPNVGNGSFSAVPGKNAPSTIVSGLTLFSGGLGSPSTFNFHWTSLQAYDDLALTHGVHSIKFGGGVERIRDNMLGASDPGGEFSFNLLSDFITNAPFSLSVEVPAALSERGLRQTIAAAYIQDDWRFQPNVTVNLGLRYEMATVPNEVHGHVSALPSLTAAAPRLGNPLFSNPTLRNFEPRVGFSWDPFGDAKTTMSGGFGMFDVLPLPYLVQFNVLFAAPFDQHASVTNLPAGSFPTGAFALAASSTNTFRQAYFDPNPKRNYVMQWNATVSRDLTSAISLRVGYVGSRGVHQPFRVEDADIVLPTLTAQGYLWPSPVGSGTRLNLNSGRITANFWEGNSYYDALQVKVKSKVGRGGELGGSYTWGKTIDTSSGSLVGDEYLNSISSPLWFAQKLNRGLADFNVTHNVEINYTWEFSDLKSAHGALRWALSGWQVGGVFEASSGVPFTTGFGGDTLGVKSIDPNIDVPNLVPGPGCASPINSGNPQHYVKTQCFSVPNPITLRGNLGRNTLIGPGLINLDASVFKNNRIKRISDSFNIQFRAEFFNILNHTNFAPPLDNRNIFDSNGNPIGNAGLITSTQTPSRQIQFALKVLW